MTRRTAVKDNDMLPIDIVELKSRKNDDWNSGERFEVKHVSYKAPNVIQIRNEESDEATFVESHQLDLVEKRAFRGRPSINSAAANAYLRWP